ncbi:MAG: glycosyltransferase family 2 protein, partial [Bacteroidales bacterium]|nr:glycosyltransferase family 2 protein [Bacteroidales bacterium]
MTDKQFKYTVIIPHYVKQPGQTELLLRLLASLPPREDLQVLVVDNSPQPIDVATLLKQAGALARTASLEVIFSQSGCGAGRARNVGLQHARGRWLLFADADDYYASDCFDVLDRELEEETDILYFNVFGQGGRVARVHRYYEQYAKTQRAELVRYMIWAPWNKVVARRLVEEQGLQFEETSIGNDAMF